MADPQRQSDYLNVLIWLETASEAQIRGALYLSSGDVRADIEQGIQALIESDRPGLATTFPELVPGRIRLDQLVGRHRNLAGALRELARAKLANELHADSKPQGYWNAMRVLRTLHESGHFNAAQYALVANELHHRVNVTGDVAVWVG